MQYKWPIKSKSHNSVDHLLGRKFAFSFAFLEGCNCITVVLEPKTYYGVAIVRYAVPGLYNSKKPDKLEQSTHYWLDDSEIEKTIINKNDYDFVFDLLLQKNPSEVICYLCDGVPSYRNIRFEKMVQNVDGQTLLKQHFSIKTITKLFNYGFNAASDIFADDRKYIDRLLNERLQETILARETSV